MEKDLNALQAQVDEWIKTVGVRYFSELTNMAMLSEEVGEVLFVLICLANQTGINLQEAFEKNMAKKTERDATRHLNNEKLK